MTHYNVDMSNSHMSEEHRVLRERLGLSRSWVARLIGVSDMSVSRFETGGRVSPELAQRFAVVALALRGLDRALHPLRDAGSVPPAESTERPAPDPVVAEAVPAPEARFDIQRRIEGKWVVEGEDLISEDEARTFAIGTLKLPKKGEGKSWDIIKKGGA